VPPDSFSVQCAAPARVSLVHEDDSNALERSLVLDLPDEVEEWQADERLVDPPPEMGSLLPAGVVPHRERANVVLDAKINNSTRHLVEDIADFVVPDPTEACNPPRSARVIYPCRNGPELGQALVVELVRRFGRPAFDGERGDASVTGRSHEVDHTQVDA